jgi:glutamate/tyrosine decarboxylase-like PLP-dependent enzyme
MRLPDSGLAPDDLLAQLEEAKANDVDWRSGRVFSYVYDGGEDVREVARAAAAAYLSENALNTKAFPSLGKLQADVVGIVADLVGGDDQTAGFMTSGGTESILCAVKAARERGRAERGIRNPNLVLPESAHAAFHKAGYYFGVETITVPVLDDYTADADAMAAAVTDETVLVVGSAPQYPQGVMDPISALAPIAADIGANFHVDACMGGMVLPFAEQLPTAHGGRVYEPWDFRVPEVTSISVDLHKLGYTPKGASVVLYRNRELRKHQTFVFDQWLGGLYASPSMSGTKPGAPIAAAWAVLHYLGRDGYLRLTRTALDAAATLADGVRAIDGMTLRGEPAAHVVCFGAADPERLDIFAVNDALADRGWFLDRQAPPDSLHATVSAGNAPVVAALVDDLAACVDDIGGARVDNRSTDYATLE